MGREHETDIIPKMTDGQQVHGKMLKDVRKTQIKTTIRYHLTPVRMTTIKKIRNNKSW